MNACRMWSMVDLKKIMTACLIMHNMIIDDEKRETCLPYLCQRGFVVRRFQSKYSMTLGGPRRILVYEMT